jgi:hypothetical protein
MRLGGLLRHAVSVWLAFFSRNSGARRRYDWMRTSAQGKGEA